MKQTETLNEQQWNEMLSRHAAERRRLPKDLKTETKTRTLMFKKSIRMSNSENMTLEQELEKIQEVGIGSFFSLHVAEHQSVKRVLFRGDK